MSKTDKFVQHSSELKFVAAQEPWTIYTLENGAQVRIRPILILAKDQGFFPKDHPQAGMPSINLQFQQIMHVDWTPEQQTEINKRRVEMGLEPLQFDLTWGG